MSVRSRLEGTPDVPRVPVAVNTPPEEQDPSMPGIPTIASPSPVLAAHAPAPEVVPVPPAPVELPEQRYTWQPTDDEGRPIGGVQVIIYKTEQEKFEKMQEKTVLLLRQLRKERREKALGLTEERVDDAEVFQNVTEFKARDLTADERFSISQDIANPEKFAEARDKLIESAFGAKPEVVASTLNDAQRFFIQQRALENYIEFCRVTGFQDNAENRTLLTGWIGTRNLAPTVANFTIASNRLREAGLLLEAPVVQQENVPTPAPVAAVAPVEEPKPQVQVTTPPALATTEPQAKRHSHVPSGLNASIASPAETVNESVDGFSMTLAEIDRMSSDDYKKQLRNPKFAAYVNKLEADAAARRKARANGQTQ